MDSKIYEKLITAEDYYYMTVHLGCSWGDKSKKRQIETINKAISMDKVFPFYNQKLHIQKDLRKDVYGAIEVATQMIDLFPYQLSSDIARTYRARAESYESLGKTKLACQDWQSSYNTWRRQSPKKHDMRNFKRLGCQYLI